MHGKALNSREAISILNNNGYVMIRSNGDHLIFKNGCNTVTITNGKAFSQKTWKRECKRVGLSY